MFDYFNTKKKPECSCEIGNSSCNNDYACVMRSRIWLVCRGHFKWLCHISRKAKEGRLHSHYWVSGEAISADENNRTDKNSRNVNELSFTNTLFHVIKAASFNKIAADKPTQYNTAHDFKDVILRLLQDLDENEKNKEYMFPRFTEEKLQTFHAADHIQIWWALRSIEELGLGLGDFPVEGKGQHQMRYTSDKVQRTILKNFMAMNPVTETAMFAVSRHLTENKFLLAVGDAVILYAMDSGLFGDFGGIKEELNTSANVIEALVRTIDYQLQDWDEQTIRSNVLQLALSMVVSESSKSMASQFTRTTYKKAKSTLLRSFSPNGTFVGQLGLELFGSETDSYWHAIFEAPYILWKCQLLPMRSKESIINDESNTVSTLHLNLNAFSGAMELISALSEKNKLLDSVLQHLNPVEVSLLHLAYEGSRGYYLSPANIAMIVY